MLKAILRAIVGEYLKQVGFTPETLVSQVETLQNEWKRTKSLIETDRQDREEYVRTLRQRIEKRVIFLEQRQIAIEAKGLNRSTPYLRV